jgi:hypothetical protein
MPSEPLLAVILQMIRASSESALQFEYYNYIYIIIKLYFILFYFIL